MENLQIVSLNIRGLQNKNKRNRMFQYFKTKKIDIILLQETYSTVQDENEWKTEKEGPVFFFFSQQPQMWSSHTLYKQPKQA